ncbi:MAG: bifunctional oligoribonuclease/PAP phosphatase NrnA [Clostridia bacterium]|nr:bifunctional oligoribonuclease/PAP phosphatase NrnA [Clostridia bacterium]
MNDRIIRPLTVAEATDAVLSSGSLAVICHTNPDGDAVGSAAALALIARGAGIRSKVFLPDPPQKRLEFIFAGVDRSADGDPEEEGFGTLCAVDVASRGQLGRFSDLSPRISFMIDHHGTGEQFAPFLLDPSASAAGEIVCGIYGEAKRRGAICADPAVSRALYAAIASDTGSFAYSNVTPLTHTIAAGLLSEISGDPGGMGADEIVRLLFEQATDAELRCRALTIRNMRVFARGALAGSLLTLSEMEAERISPEDAGGAVDLPRSLVGVSVAFIVRQTGAYEYKVSSRSTSDRFDVSRVCALFGGGGHVRAAGCTLRADSPEAAFGTVKDAFLRIL